MFYSKIILDDTEDMTFSDFNFGPKQIINIKGGKLTMFSDCAFGAMPTVTVENNEQVKFVNCFTRGGEEVSSQSEQ